MRSKIQKASKIKEKIEKQWFERTAFKICCFASYFLGFQGVFWA